MLSLGINVLGWEFFCCKFCLTRSVDRVAYSRVCHSLKVISLIPQIRDVKPCTQGRVGRCSNLKSGLLPHYTFVLWLISWFATVDCWNVWWHWWLHWVGPDVKEKLRIENVRKEYQISWSNVEIKSHIGGLEIFGTLTFMPPISRFAAWLTKKRSA